MPSPKSPRTRSKAGAHRPPSGPNRSKGADRQYAPRGKVFAKPLARAAAPRRAAPEAAAPRPPQGPLKASQKRFLRGFAHALKPVVLLGHKGLTPGVLAEVDAALRTHELIKVKLADADREARAVTIGSIATAAECEVVQAIGHVACFFRRNHALPATFELPK